ncbi:MAG: hypothetical protein IT381_17030 [Deltaproteobacteria bacterium]|nr:hypothetical protein [Deltaproteobacteria bacterium]
MPTETDTAARGQANMVGAVPPDGDGAKTAALRQEFQLRRTLESDPDNQSAFSALQTLLENAGDLARFCALGERFVERTQDQYLRAARLATLGEAYERIQDLHSAVAMHERALQIDASLGESQIAALRVCRALGLATRGIAHCKLAAANGAIEGELKLEVDAILDLAATHPIAHAAAAAWVASLGAASPVAGKLAALSVSAADVEPKLKALREEAIVTRDKSRAAANYVQMAELLFVYQKDATRARDQIDKALLLVPAQADALRLLVHVALATQTVAAALEPLKTAALKIKAKDKTRAARLLVAAAEDLQAAGAAEAAQLFGAAFECDPNDRYVLRRYTAGLSQNGQRVQALTEATQLAREPHAELHLRTLLAETHKSAGDAAGLRAAFERIAALDPCDIGALDALENERRGSGDAQGLLQLLSAHGRLLEGAERAHVLDEQAKLFASVQNSTQAYETQIQALAAWPTAERAKALIALTTNADDKDRTRHALVMAGRNATSEYRAGIEAVLAELDQARSAAAAAPAPVALSPEEQRAALRKEAAELHTRDPASPRLVEVCQQLLAKEPNDKETLAHLAHAQHATQRWSDLSMTLVRLVALNADKLYSRELAKLYEQRLGRQADAVTIYLQLFSESDRSPDVISGLERGIAARIAVADVAEALGDHEAKQNAAERAKEHFERALAETKDNVAKQRLTLKLANVERDGLRRGDAAIGRLAEAFRLAPEDRAIFEQLVASAQAANAHDVMQATLEAVIASLPNGTWKATVSLALADSYKRMSNGTQAARALLAAYVAEAASIPNTTELECTLVDYGLYDELDAFYDARVERAATGDKAELLFRAIELRIKHSRDPEKTRNHIASYFALRPADPKGVQALAQPWRPLYSPNELTRLAEEQLSVAQEPESRGHLQLLLGDLCEQADHQKAVTYLKGALDTPRGKDAVAILKTFGPDPFAAAALLPFAEKSGDDDESMRCHSILANEAKGMERGAHMRALLALWQKKKDDVGTWHAAKEAFIAEGGADPELEAQLIQLSRLLGKSAELIDVLRQAQKSAGTERAKALSLRIASTLEMENQVTDDSTIEAWRQAVAADPNNLEALGSLERALRGAGRLRDLVEVLRLRQAAEPARRVELGIELANMFAGPLQDPSQAVAEYYQAAELSPTDPRPYRGLTDLHLANRQFTEGKDTLLKELERTPDSPDRKTRLVLLARVYFEGLQDVDGATNALMDVLKAEPTHQEATALVEQVMQIVSPETQARLAEVLEPAYLAQNNFPKMALAREMRINHTPDPAKKRELMVDAAKLHETRGNDPATALSLLGQAFRLDPRDERVRADLERLAAKANNIEALAGEYEAALQGLSEQDSGPKIAIHRRLAEIYEKQLKRPNEAVTHLKAAADLAGGDTQSLDQMARLLRSQDKPQELAEVIAKQVSLMGDAQKDQRVRLLQELADLRLNKLNDKDGAVQAFQQIVTHDPKHQKALEALDKLLTELDRKQDLYGVLMLRKEVAGASDLGVDINVRLGDLTKDRPSEALIFYKTALQRRPQNAPALAALEALLDQPDVQMDVAAILEPLYTAKQDYARLAKVLEVRLSRAQQLAEKKGLMRRIGDIYENRLSMKDKAFQMSLRAMREDPADMGIRMWLEKLAQETSSFRDLADAYVEQASKAEAALALQFHRRAATLYYEKVNDPHKAIDEFKEVLAKDAKDVAGHTALEKLYGQTEQKREQSEVLLKLVDLTSGNERKLEMLLNVARLQEAIGEYQLSLETRRRIMTLAPEDPTNFDEMGSLYEHLGKPEEYVKALDTEIARIAEKRSPEARARRLDLLFRKGVTLETTLQDKQEAAKIFDLVLKEEPNHEKTINHLEERVKAGDAALAAVALERVYQQSGDWRKFIDVLEAQLGSTTDAQARKALLIKVAQTYQTKLNVKDMAFLALSRAFGEDSGDAEIRAELERLADENKNHEELVELYASEIDAITDPILKLQLTSKIADIYHQRLASTDKAVEWYRKVLSHDAQNPAALKALDKIYNETESWSALTEIIDTEVAVAEQDAEKVELLVRLAAAWGDKLFEPDAAIRALEQARGLAPNDLRVLGSLEKYFREAKAFDELAKVLRELDALHQAAPQPNIPEQVRLRAELAKTLKDHLRDPGGAVDAWQSALKLESANVEAIEALDALLRELGRFQELADMLQIAIDTTKDDALRIEYNRRQAEVMADHLGNTDVAVQRWNSVLTAEPKRVDALRALIGLHGKRNEFAEQAEMAKRLIPLVPPSEGKAVRFVRMEALSHIESALQDAVFIGREILSAAPHTPEELAKLADLFEATKAFEDAAKAVDRSVELQATPELRLKALRRSADIYLDRLNRPTAAVPSYEKILELNPTDKGAFDQVRKILRTAREWRRLVATDEGFVAQYTGDGRLELLEEIRDIHDKELGQKDLAFIASCRVFREAPIESASLAAERLAGETEGWEELCAVYEDVLEEIEDARVKIEVQRRLGRLYSERMNELGAAEEIYERLLDLAPGDADALDRLVEIRSKQGRTEDQISALENKFSHAPDIDAKKSILRQIASVWDSLAQDVEKAIATHQRILDLDPSDKIAIDNLSSLYERENRFDALIGILTRAIDLASDKKATVPLREKIGALYEGKLDNVEKAIETYRQILDIDAAQLPTLQSLERLYTQLTRWRELLEVFEKQIAVVPENEEKVKLFTKAAAVFEEHFEDKKNALVCYDNILALDQNNLSAIKHEERLLRDTKEWEKLIQVLQHHASLLGDPTEIVKLYIQIGEIFYKNMARVDKAEEYFNAARAMDPNATDALNALGKLYERSGNWFQSLEMLQKEAEAAKDSPQAVDLYYRMGKINENMLMDSSAAKGCYQRALEINSKYVPALAALKDIASGDKDWDNYVQYMVEEAEATEDSELKTELFYECGKFFAEKKDDQESAMRYYSKALEFTPDYAEAARPLADIYFRREDWANAERVLEVVVNKLDPKADMKELGQKLYRLGYLADKQTKQEVALERYERAYDVDPSYLPTLEGLGHAYLRFEKWEQALKAFNAILVNRDSLTNAEVVDLFAQTGDLLLKTKQPEKAKKQFEKALELDPQHPASLKNLSKVQEELGDFEGAYDALHRYIDLATPDERAKILLSLAQLSRERLNDPYRAIDALLEAQKAEPNNVDVLEALVQLYTDTKQVPKIAELSEQLVGLLKDDKKKVLFAMRLGDLYQKDIKDLNRSLKYYNAALDADPAQAAAFEAIEKMLGDLQQWKMLEENYRAMIARLPATARKAKAALFRTLAELYKQVLKEQDNATTAYEVVVKLDPGNQQDALTLAALYGEKPELRPKAIGMQQEIMRNAQNPVLALHELRKLYQADKKFDKVYCVCQALLYLKSANDEEKKIFEYLKKGVPAKAQKPLTEAIVKEHLLHPNLKGGIGDLAAGLYKSAPDMFTKTAKDLDLKKKDLIDVKSSQLFFVNILKYVQGALAAPMVDVYRRSGSMQELELVNARPPAVAAGEENPVFKESSHKILCYHIARNLTFARPELFLARIYPGDQLRDLLAAFVAMFNPKAGTLGNQAEVTAWVEVLQQIPEASLRRIKDLAIGAYNDMKAGLLKIFAEAAEHTAYRAALLMSGDLEVAARATAEAADGAARVAPQERVKELVLFSVSEQHFALREALGLAIKG